MTEPELSRLKPRCLDCHQIVFPDEQGVTPQLCGWCIQKQTNERRPVVFDDGALSMSEVAGLIQQGRKALRKIPPAWSIE